MEILKILEKLCYYDYRNPDNLLEIPGDNNVKPDNRSCHCDNCFYGRTILAEQILTLKAEFEQYKLESIKWSVEDFTAQDRYDITEEQAQIALEEMIQNHSCNYGITWETLEYYTHKYGTKINKDESK